MAVSLSLSVTTHWRASGRRSRRTSWRLGGICSVYLLAACVQLGCGGATTPEDSPPPVDTPAETNPATAAREDDGHRWDVALIDGKKIGYAHMAIENVMEDGRPLVKTRYDFHMTVRRFGDPSQPAMHFESLETPEGKTLRIESTLSVAVTPVTTIATVSDGRMQVDVTSKGKTQTRSLPWSDDIQGPFAVEQQLLAKPLTPGETREIRHFHPLFGDVATVRLAAGNYQKTELLDGNATLLRIDVTTVAPGVREIKETLWTDHQGRLLKMVSGIQEMYRTTKDVALAVSKDPPPDIGFLTTVPIQRELPRAHQSKRIRYRVRLREGNPADAFATGPSQQVKRTGAKSAEIIVTAIRPGAASAIGPAASGASQPTEDDLKPGSFIQSDDPRIVSMAASVAPKEQDRWRLAKALEGYVHRAIEKKDFKVVFATAAEVAASLQGDCSEHAVLLAALARARGIPARVAIGLVYSPAARVFAFHMWNEVYVGGGWYALDATLGQGGIGAAHLKLADSSTASPASLGPVAQVIGQLQIEVLEVQ